MYEPEWTIFPGLADYAATLRAMEERVEAIRGGGAREAIWLLEHPPLYTAGTSANPAELVQPDRFPIFNAGRGGRYTYHGPGQRVGYVMLDLGRRGRDVRCFVHAVEGWVIRALGRLGVESRREEGRVGIWTDGPHGEAKIGAIGVRVRRWVSFHGFSVNVAPDLDHFGGIVPCGIAEYPVTSLKELGSSADLGCLDEALRSTFPDFLGEIAASARGNLEGCSLSV